MQATATTLALTGGYLLMEALLEASTARNGALWRELQRFSP
jgi:hypothetical protein